MCILMQCSIMLSPFSQSDFDQDYYNTIMATDPFAAANYIGYKAMGQRDDSFEEYWSQAKTHYEGEAKRANLNVFDKTVNSITSGLEQTWLTIVDTIDGWIDGSTMLFFDVAGNLRGGRDQIGIQAPGSNNFLAQDRKIFKPPPR